MTNWTYPNVQINDRDKSTSQNVTTNVEPLHRPLFMSFASKGPIGIPQWDDMAGHSRRFGSDMFSTSSAYANTLPFYYINATARSQKFWFLRLDDGSDTLGFAIFAIAQTSKNSTVYNVDPVNGVDTTTPATDASGKTKTADQTQYTYVTYPISSANPLTVSAVANYFGLDPKTAASNLFLLMSVTGTSAGNFMTRNAISLDVVTPATDDVDVINRIGMPLIRLYPRYCTDDTFSYLSAKMTGANYNYSPVQNIFGSNYVDFCPTAESVIDPNDEEDYGWQPITDTAYNSLSDGYLLDYNINVNVYGGTPLDQRGSAFNGTFALAMRMYNELNVSSGVVTTPITASTMQPADYQAINAINPFTGSDVNGKAWMLLPVGKSVPAQSSATPVVFGKYSNIFDFDQTAIAKAQSVTDTNIDAATKAFFDKTTGQLANLSDPFSVSFNQIYDTAYSFQTKQNLANIIDVRDDVKIDWAADTYMSSSSQNTALPKWMAPQTPIRKPNDYQGALSALVALNNMVTLHGVDSEFGTQTFRGEIYPQSGTFTASGNRKIVVPTNYERLKERLAYYNGPTVTGSPKGRPGNVLTSFDSLSWVPKTADQKQLVWNKGANYATYADVNTLFFPDLRTVYSNDTSLFSSGTYTDYIDQLKHIIRTQWTYYVGREDSVTILKTDIARAIDTAAFQAFGGYMTTQTTVELQDSNTDNDYTALVYTNCYGNMPDRIWKTVLTAIRNSDNKTST